MTASRSRRSISWNAQFFNILSGRYVPTPVAPDAGGRYALPAQPELWLPIFQLMHWPTGVNGVYTFRVELLKPGATPGTWVDLTSSLAVGNQLTLRVDNTLPQAEIIHLYKNLAGDLDFVKPCDIVSTGTHHFQVKFNAHDPNGHLASYGVYALYGNNRSATIVPTESYASHANEHGPHRWNGVANHRGPSGGWEATCNCAHTFMLDVWKRTTNGHFPLLNATWHQSITINNVPAPACPENQP